MAMGMFNSEVSKLRVFDFSLRLFMIPFSIASIWIVVTDQENNLDYGKLEFKTLMGLKYMVCISVISAGYALFGAACSWFNRLVTQAWFFFFTDQVLAYLMVTSMAAFTEFLYLAYNGDQVVSWSQACVSYGKFCGRLRLALGLHVIAVLCFLVLAVISACRVFRQFEPPSVPSKETGPETRT